MTDREAAEQLLVALEMRGKPGVCVRCGKHAPKTIRFEWKAGPQVIEGRHCRACIEEQLAHLLGP